MHRTQRGDCSVLTPSGIPACALAPQGKAHICLAFPRTDLTGLERGLGTEATMVSGAIVRTERLGLWHQGSS